MSIHASMAHAPPCSVRRVQPGAHSIIQGRDVTVDSRGQHPRAASPSSGALKALPTMSIPTCMCMVLTRLCLLPVGVEGRLHQRPIWRQAQQQHGVLLECPPKPSAAWRPAHGAFVTSFVVPLGERSRPGLLLSTPQSFRCLPACLVYLLLLLLLCFVLRCCF